MRALIDKLKNNAKCKKAVFICLIVFLFLYTFSIPAFSGRSPWYLISYFLMAALTFFTGAYHFLYKKISFNKNLLLPASFVMFTFVGTALYSREFRHWLTLVLMFVTLVVFYYAFSAIAKNRLIYKILISAFGAFALYFIVVYRSEIFSLDISGSRIGSYFDNVNAIGFYFAIAFALSLYVGLVFEKKRELVYILLAGMFFVLGFFTGSRSFLISVIGGGIAVLYARLKNHKIIFLILCGSFIGLLLILIKLPTFYFLKDQFDRTFYTLFGIGNSKTDVSTVQRIVWPGYAFYLSGKNLIFGLGVNGFSIFSGIGTYAHNNFAELLCNFGVIGFLLFNACYVIPLALSIKAKEKDVFIVFVVLVVFLFRNFFGVTYYTKEAYLLLALMFYLTRDCSLPMLYIFISKNNLKNYVEVEI